MSWEQFMNEEGRRFTKDEIRGIVKCAIYFCTTVIADKKIPANQKLPLILASVEEITETVFEKKD